MPELPEVETIRKTLENLVINKTIENITVHWPKIIKQPDDVEHFKTILKNETIRKVDRRGKFLLFYLTDHVLVSHLRMEGKYRVVPMSEPVAKHTHVIFHFTDGSELRYHDVRKFGTMHVFPTGSELNTKPLNQLGPDPFQKEYTKDYVLDKVMKTTRNIKATLLDQSIIAGLGNIYVDEVLFLSNVHPEKRANKLTENEVKTIWKNAHLVLEKAVKQGGTTIRSYVDGAGEMGMFQQELFVYGQQNKQCKVCGVEIIKLKVAGRGTHICPKCQSL
ncbi:DNA-formamidopyrimidine glycosylase [Pseudogracilibacillus auburnensis]|uniref:Formamidopyrimidine-DNA glycosylase n=1 Tax=Pseudogracilibacillus auburnensis TaxID=1494959 RepID=A0A2V3VZ80_9BACI|nr:DNA-formamidopyrimidine glycosylase [Pseudogracilibacillus auburnensis]PXW85285.1 DNA-(apurinic or apyrimidinic site) lyase [Pseudogracilibacillus auburnensis]